MPSAWQNISFETPSTTTTGKLSTEEPSLDTDDCPPDLEMMDGADSHAPSDASNHSSPGTILGGDKMMDQEETVVSSVEVDEKISPEDVPKLEVTENQTGEVATNGRSNGSNGARSTSTPKKSSPKKSKRSSDNRGRSRTPQREKVNQRVKRKAKSNVYKEVATMKTHYTSSSSLQNGGASKSPMRGDNHASSKKPVANGSKGPTRADMRNDDEYIRISDVYKIEEDDEDAGRYSVVIEKVFEPPQPSIKSRELDLDASGKKKKKKRFSRDWILFFLIVGAFFALIAWDQLSEHSHPEEAIGHKRWTAGKKTRRHVDHMPHLSMKTFLKALQPREKLGNLKKNLAGKLRPHRANKDQQPPTQEEGLL